MLLSYLFAFLAIIGVSLAIFLVVRTNRESSSYWVNRMIQITAKLNQVHPVLLAIGFVTLIFLELGLIVYVVRFYADAIKILFVFATFNCAFIVLTLWLDKSLGRLGKYPWLILRLIVSAMISLSWLVFPGEWLIYDLVGLVGGVALLSLFPSLSFKRAMALGAGIVLYDIIGVYVTGWIIQVAGGLNFVPPAVIYVPAVAVSAAPQVAMMIGVGDIFFGGILMATARLYGAEKQAFLGYSLAIGFAYALAKITNHGVPATMFIIPFMLMAIWLVVRAKNDSEAMVELMK